MEFKEEIQEIATKGVQDKPSPNPQPVVWNVTDDQGAKWQIRPLMGQPGKFYITTASVKPYPKADKEVDVSKALKEPLTQGHQVDCTCSKCYLAKKALTGAIATPKLGVEKCLLKRMVGTASDTWWINNPNPIYIKHLSTRPIHAYGMTPSCDQTVCIWDQLYQINFYWRITPVDGQPGYYFFYQYEGDFHYALQQMGGTNNIPDRVSMWYVDAVVAKLPWVWLKVLDASPDWYGPNYLWFRFGHNNYQMMLDNTQGYNYWPLNGVECWQAPLVNTIDPCWYFYFELVQ